MILIDVVVVLTVLYSPILGSPVYTSSVYQQRGQIVPADYLSGYTPLAGASLPVYDYRPQGLSPCGGVLASPCYYEPLATSPVAAPLQKVAVVPQTQVVNPGFRYSYYTFDDGTKETPLRELKNGDALYGDYSVVPQPYGFSFITNFIPQTENHNAEANTASIEEPEHNPDHEGHGETEEVESKEAKESPDEGSIESEPVNVSAEDTTEDTSIPENEDICSHTHDANKHGEHTPTHEEQPTHEEHSIHAEHTAPEKHPAHDEQSVHEEHTSHGKPESHEKPQHGHPEGHVGTKPAKTSPLTYYLVPYGISSPAFGVPPSAYGISSPAYAVPKPC